MGSLKTSIVLLAGVIRLPKQQGRPKSYWEWGLNSVCVASWPGDFGGTTSVTKEDKVVPSLGGLNEIMHTKAPSLCCLFVFPPTPKRERVIFRFPK